jgi:hypothetical protein
MKMYFVPNAADAPDTRVETASRIDPIENRIMLN